MNRQIIFIFLFASIFISAQPITAHAESTGSAETWDAMMSGIRTYSSDRKLREQFDTMCQDNKTAVIDGRIDTGGGVYMVMDVPVYSQPGKSKRTQLPHETTVIPTGASQEFDGKIWEEIEFLFISGHSNAAVSIDKAWIEASNLK
jgi:hypothetical protein